MVGSESFVNFISYVGLGLFPDIGCIIGAILIAFTIVSAFCGETVSLYCENCSSFMFRPI